ncbi:MAG: hypothetical protein OEY45_03755 [Gammaproteobacteria bacterium]|nr:hypothetical protein [Gammaproteobacteria bacterium]MDH5514254.1 hypothetical protein [Gammaproteobacteria bacterium]
MLVRKLVLVLCAVTGSAVSAAETSELDLLRAELEEIRHTYESSIEALEERIRQLESSARAPVAVADTASPAVPVAQEKPSDFNPAIGVVLVGTATDFSPDNDFAVPGFMIDEEAGPGEDGFSVGESELNAKVNIDDRFFGNFTLAVADEDGSTEVELEEAWFETLTLPHGLQLRGGRFFSGIGYRNQFHRHADDFVDRPLPYRVFMNGQYIDDGVQVRWLAPTEQYLEFGAEWLRGAGFPAGGAGRDGKGAWSLFARSGGDIGSSHSWQAGLSWLSARAEGRESGNGDSFDGDVGLALLDGVWKWAPNGNPSSNNLKLEGGLFWQNQDGLFTPGGGGVLAYDDDQHGGYLEGIYQFKPHWRAGVRYAWLDTDDPGAAFSGTSLDTLGVSPKIYSVTLDWSHSEFSRLRLQYSRDESNIDAVDRWYLQYLMSLGAHGAHRF